MYICALTIGLFGTSQALLAQTQKEFRVIKSLIVKQITSRIVQINIKESQQANSHRHSELIMDIDCVQSPCVALKSSNEVMKLQAHEPQNQPCISSYTCTSTVDDAAL